MLNPFRTWFLSVLKVPPEPHPPAGSPGSLRVFRAGRNYFRLRLAGWGFTQLFALAGIIFWVVVLIDVEAEARHRKENGEAPAPFNADSFAKTIESFAKEAEASGSPDNAVQPVASEGTSEGEQSRKRGIRYMGYNAWKQMLVTVAIRLPDWVLPLLWVLKVVGIVIYLVQIPFTYFLRRLDYELRWYIVTDRSLRLRWGVAKVTETTMSFANLQQVEMTQNPIQRLLGLADVRVQSAGGGSGKEGNPQDEDSMHRARFHAVDNAPEIRDLILERLRRFRQAGLGDPDDPNHAEEHAPPPPPPPGDALEAAREVLAEARALRSAL
ncbi:MAG TPA: PH domain-containing protein [Opitutaceae bacterium]|nr:PH domain-containing protein [Opitutaceae bacterium]